MNDDEISVDIAVEEEEIPVEIETEQTEIPVETYSDVLKGEKGDTGAKGDKRRKR